MSSDRFKRYGDLKNSDFFEEYLEKLYEWKSKEGLNELIGAMDHVTIEVAAEDREAYIKELSLMTPYHFTKTVQSDQLMHSVMEIDPENPALVIRVNRNPQEDPVVHSMNSLSRIGSMKPHSRYIGEFYRTSDINALFDILKAADVRFKHELVQERPLASFVWSLPSQYTWNSVGYIEFEGVDHLFGFSQEDEYEESPAFLDELAAIKEAQKEKIGDKILPIDHLATRVFQQEREHAILELVKMTSYYYWGSYAIDDQNSSTNVCRNIHGVPEAQSPAKVFTAAHTPHILDFITEVPSPTESFVFNYGRRMHHLAYEIMDDTPDQNEENIEATIDALEELGVEFLVDVIGSKDEGLKQIFSRASDFSYLITEYVQRYGGFQGFFTKENVAVLTEAAGKDEHLRDWMGERDLCD
jgi:hypothetical protein